MVTMLRSGSFLVVLLCTTPACVVDRLHGYERPAHFETVVNARHIAPVQRPVTSIARTTGETSTTSEVPDTGGGAGSIALRFTMRARWNTYLGAEAEAGAMAREGSNLAGGYGVAGMRHPFRFGALSAEVAAGWRGLRDALNAPDRSDYVLEPRVRGEMWLGPQVSLGATAGADLTTQGAWVAGMYVGIHSLDFGGDRD
ncbi:MAG: hypothetical protein HOV81_45070 [Kofleriaceae bacterium]|nr:hypothetical protein [Kofleriaceae bacterium]